MHVYIKENPNATIKPNYKHEFGVNVWAEIIKNIIVGPVVFSNRLNEDRFLDCLKNTLPKLLSNAAHARQSAAHSIREIR